MSETPPTERKCEGCGTSRKVETRKTGSKREEHDVCEVCYSTMAGNALIYYTELPVSEHTIIRAVAECTNMILERLDALEIPS